MKITKRDGRKVEFDSDKIVKAISKAFIEVYPDGRTDEMQTCAHRIANEVAAHDDLTVEEIQDTVVRKLMASKYKDVAKAYVEYRYLHRMARSQYAQLMDAIAEKLEARDVKNQNANVDEHSFGGRVGEASSVVNRKYALEYLVSPMAKANHINNEVYIHDLDSYAVGMHNCFQRDTKFLTTEGIKKFSDFRDGDKVKVLTKDGNWKEATVHCYGRQPMYHVTLRRGNLIKSFNCTRNHRWVLHDGSVTDNLQVGDRLFPLDVGSALDYVEEREADEFLGMTKREADMFCFGFVIGDGCDHGNNIQARICGDKVKYLKPFEIAQYRKSYIKDSSDIICFKQAEFHKQEFLDHEMWRLLSFDDKVEIFAGYMAADGSKTTSTKLVWTSDVRVLNMIKDLSALCGYHIHHIREIKNSTNYVVDRILYEVTFTTSYGANSAWTVTDIVKQPNTDYEAWCVEEPETHTFTLDGGIVTGNCLSIPFDDLLANGFNTRQTDVRPAQSINTAFQLVAVIFQLQSLQQFGGVSATHLDWTMVPYVRKSFYKHFCDGVLWCESPNAHSGYTYWERELKGKVYTPETPIDDELYDAYANAKKYAMAMTVKECYQAVEGMYHNLNTLQSRSGNQLPFSSINYGTCTLPEGRMVIKALLDVSIKGMGKLHKTSIFPCGIFQCMNGVNRHEGEPNYDLFRLTLKSTSLRLYPNYANVDWSGNAGYDRNDPKTYFSTMGCRTANGWDINGFGQLKDGRGNICPVTIIMPTLAMEAKDNLKGSDANDEDGRVGEFLALLDQKIHEAKDMLIERFNWICSQSPDSAKFMYENHTMAGYVPEEGIRSALKHGTLAIGQLGLAETLQILIGCDHTTPEGMELAKRIEQLFKDRCAEFKEREHLNFGVYYTPAENLCYTAMQKFKAKYGEIPNVSDKDFFTNSIHVPVWRKVNPIEKIDIESQLTGYSSAGCITYVELESSVKHNIDGLEALVNYAMDKDIPYFAINVPNDLCMDCGYTEEIGDACPMCGSKHIQRLRRVTGYLTGDYTMAFNKGKQQEVEMRVKHDEVMTE